MPKCHFTDAFVRSRKLPEGKAQLDYFEVLTPGRSLVLTLNKSGRHVWSAMFYEHGKARRKKLGWANYSDASFPELNVKQARQAALAFDVQGFLASGRAGSFKTVAESWLKRHVTGKLRSEKEIERHLYKYVMPTWADRPFTEIRRVDVAELLDKIEDQHGPRMADCVLTTLRSLMNWHQARDDHYTTPIVKGMKRQMYRLRREAGAKKAKAIRSKARTKAKTEVSEMAAAA